VTGANRDLYLESYDGARSALDTTFTATLDVPFTVELVLIPGEKLLIYIDGELEGTKTTNIPSGTGGNSRMGWWYKRTAGTTSWSGVWWTDMTVSTSYRYGG